jgi:hypothetical protein
MLWQTSFIDPRKFHRYGSGYPNRQ